MDNILYYPYINIPRSDWTIRTLLYYNQVGSIVPQKYFYNPDNYEEFMRELVTNELVIPINPIVVLERPWEVFQPFIKYMNSKEFNLNRRRENFRKSVIGKIHIDKYKFDRPEIHVDKFDGEIFYQIEQAGLARRKDHELYVVEQRTANDLMSFLASVIGCKLNFLPTTDKQFRNVPFTRSYNTTNRTDNIRREIILKELIPFPEQIDISRLRKFKDNHIDLLNRFKNKVELIALDHNLNEESQLFKETIKELNFHKEELSNRMNESRLGKLIFGTVCGMTGSIISIVSAGTNGTIVSSLAALPSFANAIYSALQIVQIKNITNLSGMKYLALIDKKIRRPSAKYVI